MDHINLLSLHPIALPVKKNSKMFVEWKWRIYFLIQVIWELWHLTYYM